MFLLCRWWILSGCKESLVLKTCPSNSQPTVFAEDAVQNSVLCSPWPASWAGWDPENPLLPNSLNSLPSWIQWEQTALSICSLLEEHLCAGSLTSHISAPFLKDSMWYPYHSTESLSGSLCISLPPKPKWLSWSWLVAACWCFWQTQVWQPEHFRRLSLYFEFSRLVLPLWTCFSLYV